MQSDRVMNDFTISGFQQDQIMVILCHAANLANLVVSINFYWCCIVSYSIKVLTDTDQIFFKVGGI